MRISCLCSSLILATALVLVFVLPFDVIWRKKFGSLLRGANSYWMDQLQCLAVLSFFKAATDQVILPWPTLGSWLMWKSSQHPNSLFECRNGCCPPVTDKTLQKKMRSLEMSWVGKGNAKNTQEIESGNKFASHRIEPSWSFLRASKANTTWPRRGGRSWSQCWRCSLKDFLHIWSKLLCDSSGLKCFEQC